MHRSDARQLVALISRDPSLAYLPLTVRKSPTAEGIAAEGGELFATGLADISPIVAVNSTAVDIAVALQGQDFSEDGAAQCVVRLTCSTPLVPRSALQSLTEKNIAGGQKSSAGLPQSLLNKHQVSSQDPNKDAVGLLRDEISAAIERVAQEYLSLYPIAASADLRANSSSSPTNEDPAAAAKHQEGRKAEFLNYLAANGIFHELKERLKGSVQQIIRNNYSSRGRALGRSAELRAMDVNDPSATSGEQLSDDRVESVLGELYVFLMKECSAVLNSLFSETVVDRQVGELERNARVDDEDETVLQQLTKLSNQADDAAADLRFEASEMIHLECIHLVNRHACLGSNASVVHSVYARYGEFLLGYSAALLTSPSTSPEASVENRSKDLILRAREALSTAVDADGSAWRVALLYAGVLVECDQQELAEVALLQVLSVQLSGKDKSGGKFALGSFSALDGYESDRLVPADPQCYSALAALFSLQSLPLKCRKALRLANR